MHSSTEFIDYFLEHPVKVKAVMYEPAMKMQQDSQLLLNSAASPASSSTTIWIVELTCIWATVAHRSQLIPPQKVAERLTAVW